MKLLLALLLISNFSSAQTSEIKIEFIGNCGLHITDGSTNIYSDFPYKSGAYHYMKYDSTELDRVAENSIFIFTHKHADHYSKKALKYIRKTKKGKKYDKWNISKLEKLKNTIPDFDIQAIKTKHRLSFGHYSYVITWHDKKIYLSGDTESAETINQVTGIDYAFIPNWIVSDALENNIEIDAKVKVIYHLYPNERHDDETNDKVIILDKQNTIITIPFD